jgi:hypothetical protein
MKKRLQILDDTYKNNFVDVAIKFTGERCPFSIAYSGHNVTVTRNGIQASFPFYGSIYKPQYTIEDIPDIIMCVITDMFTYMNCNDYEDFAAELGYSLPEAKKIYKELEKQYNDLIPIFDNPCKVYDYISNHYNV